MDLVTPEIGLIFWTTIVFTLLLVVLKKYAWKPILDSVDKRNKSIEDALKAADKAKEEMASLNVDNKRILAEAKKERDLLLKEAREIKKNIISEAKKNATAEADKIIVSAKSQINNDKMKALIELKNHVASLSIEMTEKISCDWCDKEISKSNMPRHKRRCPNKPNDYVPRRGRLRMIPLGCIPPSGWYIDKETRNTIIPSITPKYINHLKLNLLVLIYIQLKRLYKYINCLNHISSIDDRKDTL